MCYPKPGPRCSASAATALLKAKMNARSDNSFENKMALHEAQEIYNSTPAGQKELARRLQQSKHTHNESEVKRFTELLRKAKETRASQLLLANLNESGDVPHKATIAEAENSRHPFTTKYDFGEPLTNANAQKSEQVVSDSTNWIHSLDADEIEAVAWYTSSGSGTLNAHLAGVEPSYSFGETKKHITTTIACLDKALAKAKHDEPVTIWRGVSYDSMGDDNIEPEDYVKENFQVGETYTPKTYMSTSADFTTAAGFSGGIILEIKAKTAGSASNISAWGIREAEYITPRDKTYKVASVETLKRKLSDRFTKTYYVVKLEEL